MKGFILFILLVISIPNSVCDCEKLDKYFNKEFLENWNNDSLGEIGLRKELLSTFIELPSQKKVLDVKGLRKKCIIKYLGKPNKVTLDEDGIEVIVYYLSIDWLNKKENDYEGVTLEFTFDKGKVFMYSIMIT